MRSSLILVSLCVLSAGCKSNTPAKDAAPAATKSEAKADGPAPDEQVESAAGPATIGQWVGSLSLPGGQTLEWAVSVQPSQDGDGLSEAKLWIPAQMITGTSLGPVKVGADGSMKVEFAAVGAQWTIVPGATPTCSFAQKGAEFPCTISSTDVNDFAAIASPERPQTPEPPFPYAVAELEIPNPDAEGVTLAATLTIPEGEGPHPAVVMISGSGLQDRDETIANHKPFWVIADHLSRNGVAVLRYDDRGFGESTGDGTKATLEDFASDSWAAAAALAARPEIDGERVGLIGHSEGGVIAPLVAAEHPDDIDFIVLLAGTGVTGSEIVIHQQSLLMAAKGADKATIEEAEASARELHAAVLGNSAEAAPAALEALLRAENNELTDEQKKAGDLDAVIAGQIEVLNSPWFRHFLAWDPAPVLARVKVPVLAMFGDLDLQVDVEQNLAPVQAALRGNKGAEFVLLPGLNHLFQPATTGMPDEYGMIEMTIEPAVLDELARWIRVTTGLDEPQE
ncbi:Alpha/beta hydrolase family protein [Enhygromyxa salina]|uniref:Alpha/beta hydrolase family protein n=1 Tax=Enhygromyxa salina TaxID=215803 RepID=A0A2S9XSI0_9BACT|nr:alpha/beta hydrolase [Enhygromyxa salina]PRP95819.1 Alpha/beta hydrolase family protein [Enhygromyxa salina]